MLPGQPGARTLQTLTIRNSLSTLNAEPRVDACHHVARGSHVFIQEIDLGLGPNKDLVSTISSRGLKSALSRDVYVAVPSREPAAMQTAHIPRRRRNPVSATRMTKDPITRSLTVRLCRQHFVYKASASTMLCQ
jgi:hypothetical protein